jgi:hypothetical protein
VGRPMREHELWEALATAGISSSRPTGSLKKMMAVRLVVFFRQKRKIDVCPSSFFRTNVLFYILPVVYHDL